MVEAQDIEVACVAGAVDDSNAGTAAMRANLYALGGEIRARAAQVETERRVPMSSIEALRGIGYFDIVKPKAFGGSEQDFATLVDLNIDLAKWCASTAWVAGLLAAHQWLVGSFPEQAQRDVWGRPRMRSCAAPTRRHAMPKPSMAAIASVGDGVSRAVAIAPSGRCAPRSCRPRARAKCRRRPSCSCPSPTMSSTIPGMSSASRAQAARHWYWITFSYRRIVCCSSPRPLRG